MNRTGLPIEATRSHWNSTHPGPAGATTGCRKYLMEVPARQTCNPGCLRVCIDKETLHNRPLHA